MEPAKQPSSSYLTMTFDEFWAWLQRHPNCILRASTPEAVLFDDDDLHWTFTSEEDGTLVVQVVHGKRIHGEILVRPQDVTYVQMEPHGSGPEEEFVFELISETESSRVATYQFVMAHGFDEDPDPAPSGWRH